MASATLSVAGFIIFIKSTDSTVRYGSLFLCIPGSYTLSPTITAWTSNNSAPHIRRATAIAIVAIASNSGGILSTWLLGYISTAPRFTSGITTLLAFSVGLVVVSGLNLWYLAQQNKKKAIIRASMRREDEDKSLGDRSAWFVYSL